MELIYIVVNTGYSLEESWSEACGGVIIEGAEVMIMLTAQRTKVVRSATVLCYSLCFTLPSQTQC